MEETGQEADTTRPAQEGQRKVEVSREASRARLAEPGLKWLNGIVGRCSQILQKNVG